MLRSGTFTYAGQITAYLGSDLGRDRIENPISCGGPNRLPLPPWRYLEVGASGYRVRSRKDIVFAVGLSAFFSGLLRPARVAGPPGVRTRPPQVSACPILAQRVQVRVTGVLQERPERFVRRLLDEHLVGRGAMSGWPCLPPLSRPRANVRSPAYLAMASINLREGSAYRGVRHQGCCQRMLRPAGRLCGVSGLHEVVVFDGGLAEPVFLDLTARGHRVLVNEVHVLGHLVAGDVLAAVFLDVFFG